MNKHTLTYFVSDGDINQYASMVESFRAKAKKWNETHKLGGVGIYECLEVKYDCDVVVNHPCFVDLSEFVDMPFPPPQVEVSDDIVLLHSDKFGTPYGIPLRELKDSASVLSWVRHLCEKDWVGTRMIIGFIDACEDILNTNNNYINNHSKEQTR